MRAYSFNYFLRDVLSGVTVGLMTIPIALAYAEITNLPAFWGLYSSWFGTALYTLLGTSRHCVIGQSAITSILTAGAIALPTETVKKHMSL